MPRRRSGRVPPAAVSVSPQPCPAAAPGRRAATARWSSAPSGAPPETTSCDRGEVVGADARVAGERGHDRRGDHEHGRALTLDHGEERLELEARHGEHRGAARERAAEHDHEPHDVAERSHRGHDVARAERQAAVDLARPRSTRLRVRERDALRRAGRPARVGQQRDVRADRPAPARAAPPRRAARRPASRRRPRRAPRARAPRPPRRRRARTAGATGPSRARTPRSPRAGRPARAPCSRDGSR